jgi:biopolymer transport protein ExbB/TolQ
MNFGMLEGGIAMCALIISMGAVVVTLESRISTLEANEETNKEKLEYMYKMHEAARTDLRDNLKGMGMTLQAINETLGRVDERTKAHNTRLTRMEEGR